MKEATGELNLTLITVVAIAAIAAIFYAFVWPSIKVSIWNNTCRTECGEDNFEEATRATFNQDAECDCTKKATD